MDLPKNHAQCSNWTMTHVSSRNDKSEYLGVFDMARHSEYPLIFTTLNGWITELWNMWINQWTMVLTHRPVTKE